VIGHFPRVESRLRVARTTLDVREAAAVKGTMKPAGWLLAMILLGTASRLGCGGKPSDPSATPTPLPPAGLFIAVPETPETCGERTFRCRYVRVDFALLEDSGNNRTPLRLNFFDDAVFVAELDWYKYVPAVPEWVWSGHFPGYQFSGVNLGFRSWELRLSGTVDIPTTYPRNYYSIERARGDTTGLHLLREVDPQRRPGDPIGQ
jgi:hypothetical protein